MPRAKNMTLAQLGQHTRAITVPELLLGLIHVPLTPRIARPESVCIKVHVSIPLPTLPVAKAKSRGRTVVTRAIVMMTTSSPLAHQVLRLRRPPRRREECGPSPHPFHVSL